MSTQPNDPWPHRGIPEVEGRAFLKKLSDVSYHEACDNMSEIGFASAARYDAARIAIDARFRPWAVEALVKDHRGLVQPDDIMNAMLEILYAHLNRAQEAAREKEQS